MQLYWFRTLQPPKTPLNNLLLLRFASSTPSPNPKNSPPSTLRLLNSDYPTDEWTNLTPKIASKLGANLHTRRNHPLSHVRQRIVNHFYQIYANRTGNPLFSVYDNLSPIVSTRQNFDSLLVALDHPSRKKSDCYYVNERTLLRAHTTAHQSELIAMGLDNFLVVGDVYRRDEIDSTHYPVFHQVDGVRLCTKEEVFREVQGEARLELFEHRGVESKEKQPCHSLEAVKVMEHDLKRALVGLAQTLFGQEVKYQWVDQYFPFTHPSWELEIYHEGKWLEILGCGIIRQEILQKAGTSDRIGWAFGLGLERLAMCLYSIPNIRLFWSEDSGFLNQFVTDDVNKQIVYKPVSLYPQCINDLSFWLPTTSAPYCSNDFYDLAREIGGDVIEQVLLIDEFTHPKTRQVSHCYRIVYRHMERVLSQLEVSEIHKRIERAVEEELKGRMRS